MNLGLETETLEFKRTTAELKVACISICAMLNKHGVATLYFGVKPNGDICGQQVSESSLRDVSRIIFESIRPQIYPVIERLQFDNKDVIRVEANGSETPYSAFGKYYIRTADEDRDITPAELKAIFSESAYKKKWEMLESGYSVKDVDEKALKSFYESSVNASRMPEGKFTIKPLLKKAGLIIGDNLNNAGNILFAINGPVTLKLATFATDEKLTFLDQLTVQDNIYNLISIAENYILKNIRWKSEIEGMERVEIPEIPLPVIREIIANSFAHAKYSTGTNHEICVHPNMITIYSPGSFASIYSPADYAKKNLPSVIRNELIAKNLYLCKKIEQFGSGLRRVDNFCRDAHIKYTYENDELGFKFIIYRLKFQSEMPNVTLDVTLNGTEMAVLALLKQNPNFTRAEISERISKTIRTVQRALDSLKENGYIERRGSKRDVEWIVLKEN